MTDERKREPDSDVPESIRRLFGEPQTLEDTIREDMRAFYRSQRRSKVVERRVTNPESVTLLEQRLTRGDLVCVSSDGDYGIYLDKAGQLFRRDPHGPVWDQLMAGR